ncbi:YcgL domain-containing protein [Thiopseudomonas alkaliphila]|uniref:YcgL domain-containing protein n=1 Tax=Thiopseudomonas alkaliphila TaxID=1697053 RepID=UPI002576D299|nr:YcgL domain-containing protein [Thiopseudomonas alkaliphila]MDM1707004.1 YcgL domain-containing protein [Thiopseudomonas alkaliphila]
MKIICSIYQSSKKPGMYLYVPKADELNKVPEALLSLFGRPKFCFSLLLTPEKQLAREDITQVLENLKQQGFHLQMPPPEEEYIEHLPEELLRRNDPV